MSLPPGGKTPGMGLNPKDIIASVLGRNRTAPGHATSGSPHTVGAPKPGEPGAPRSSTSSARTKKTARRRP